MNAVLSGHSLESVLPYMTLVSVLPFCFLSFFFIAQVNCDQHFVEYDQLLLKVITCDYLKTSSLKSSLIWFKSQNVYFLKI